jgi:hypothetical protein
VGGGLFDQFGFGPGGLRFGEVEAGDLEAVEEETGAAGIDVVGGNALEDLADGVLDGRAVFGERELEGGAAAASGAWILYRFAGVVVVVAEVFSAEAWASAAVAVGEDVAALIAFGCFGVWRLVLFDGGVVHWSLPAGYFLVQSLRMKRVRSGLASPGPSLLAVKGEGPAFGRALFSYLVLFYRIE